jgi:hypothetical protein
VDNAQDSARLQATLTGSIPEVPVDVAQNFGNQFSGQWQVVDGLGREVYRFRGAGNNQADANRIAALWARENNFDGNLEVLPVMIESIDPISGAGSRAPVMPPKLKPQPPVKPINPAVKLDVKKSQNDPYADTYKKSVSESLEETPIEVLLALDLAAQKNGYKNWQDVKTNPRSPQAVMTVARLANTIMKTTTPKHGEKIFYKNKTDEDYSPDNPPGPESKPTMPKGTVRVDVSDMYDWYKLGKNISNLKGVDKNQFGKGPPSTIVSFGDEDTEHQYIKDLQNLGLDTIDIDPLDPNQPAGMPRQTTDPTYNVDENFADGKGPGRPGDSQRHGIPKGATMAELEKASHAKGRKGQLARWQLNMRRGHKK